MEILNFFQINDWEIGKFFKLIAVFQILVVILILMDFVGLQVPVIRQAVFFIYLTFIPGMLVLRALKIHNLDSIENLCYSAGLSLTIIMFSGFFTNIVYPILGISKPISAVPLTTTLTVLVIALCLISYMRDRDFANPKILEIKFSSSMLFLCLLPFLAIFGTYILNYYSNNFVLMLSLVVVGLVPILAIFNVIEERLYPLAIFAISIFLLYHASLISTYLWGWDIHTEYYLANSVVINSLWDPTIPDSINAMLSIVMLAPIYSYISEMDLIWVFKIFYPFLFSLVPLGLYQIFRKQTNNKIAFLSCFFFMSISTFYCEMPSLARQQIAELFLILLILLMINKNSMYKMQREILFILFGFSLAVSHYGLSYIYMLSLVSVWLALAFADVGVYTIISREKRFAGALNRSEMSKTISSSFILSFIVFTITWYIYVSISAPFESIIRLGNHIANSIFTEFLSPEASHALNLIVRETASPLHEITKYLNLFSQFLIVVGVITLLLKRSEMRFEREYKAFSLVNFILCVISIGLPYLTYAFSTGRLYHYSLIFLAPFCVIGGITIFIILGRIFKISWINKPVSYSLKALSVLFAILLLCNSGWIYEIAKDHPNSLILSQEWIKKYGNINEKIAFYEAIPEEQNIFSAKWLSINRNRESRVYADFVSRNNILQAYGMIWRKDVFILSKSISASSSGYIYLRNLNVAEGIVHTGYHEYSNISEISILEKSMRIYSNGKSEIYYVWVNSE